MALRALPSSSSTSEWTYDVFLSFRGKDTRMTFTGNLYKALDQRGIRTFFDEEEVKRGEEIGPSLVKAIKESRIAIIVFSQNFASSTFCLDELVNILEHIKGKDQLVWPIFYNVDPSEIRHLIRSSKDSLAKHEERFKDDKEKVLKWKLALQKAANLSGYHFKSRDDYEHKFIERIVEEVSRKINHIPLHVANNPVGLEPPLHEVISFLELELGDRVNMVGIYGTGGIGKSTIARALYNDIFNQFEGACFLAHVRENSNKYGLEQLQERLLGEAIGERNIKMGDVYQGIPIMKMRLQNKKILLVLDDVDRIEQLEVLAGGRDWFGKGSRVIITTRNMHLLTHHVVDSMYEMKELNHNKALELFSWKAFKSNKIDPNFLDLSNRIVHLAGGLPLALEVIGSNLFGRGINEWHSALLKYESMPYKEIHEVLKVSYDDLEDTEKDIFLDIACCFKGEPLGYVTHILSACNDPTNSISVLVERCMLKIDSSRVTMHDLIQKMGKEIVRQESPKHIGERSRLWSYNDIVQVLEENMGSNKIEVIILDPTPKEIEVHWKGRAFKKMENLRILIIRNTRFSQGPKYLPNSLRVLEWLGSLSSHLLKDFHGQKLVILKLRDNCFFREGRLQAFPSLTYMAFPSLTYMEFNSCDSLQELPDLSGAPNIKELCLNYCKNLKEIHDSNEILSELKILSAKGCISLSVFPRAIRLPSLVWLNLHGCESLCQLLDLSGAPNLKRLCLNYCKNLTEIHDSVGFLKELQTFSAKDCINLFVFPCAIRLPSLEKLDLNGCKNLQSFPEILEENDNLWTIDIGRTGIEELPSSILKLKRLVQVNLYDCGNLNRVPSGILMLPEFETLIARSSRRFHFFKTSEGVEREEFLSFLYVGLSSCDLKDDFFLSPGCVSSFSHVTHLDLRCNSFTVFPASFNQCHSLEMLFLDCCEQLQEIQEIPPNVLYLSATKCTSLSSQSSRKLARQVMLKTNRLFVLSGREVPKWFDYTCNDEALTLWFRKKVPVMTLCFVSEEKKPYGVHYASFSVLINGVIKLKREVVPEKFQDEYYSLVSTDLLIFNNLDLTNLCNEEQLLEQEWTCVEIILNSINNLRTSFGICVSEHESSLQDIRFDDPNLFQSRKKQRTLLDVGACEIGDLE